MKYNVKDISNILTIKGIVNFSSYSGIIIGAFLFLGIAVNKWNALLSFIMIIASLQVRNGSITGGIAQVLIAISMAGVFWYEYQTTSQSFAKVNLKLIVLFIGFSIVIFVGLISNVFLKRKYPLIVKKTDGLKEWRNRFSRKFISKKRDEALLIWGLGIAFSLLFMAPFIWIVISLSFEIKHYNFFKFLGKEGAIYEKAIILFFIPCVSGYLATIFFIRAKRLASLGILNIREIDTRQPILLLRSFQDDTTPLPKTVSPNSWFRSIIFKTLWTFEETLEETLCNYGPVIAIGRPDEKLPPAGAAREYIPNDSWRERVKSYICESQLIVIILGKTEGLEFEYRALAELNALGKLVIAFPPVEHRDLEERWNIFNKFALNQKECIDDSDIKRALFAYFNDEKQVVIITSKKIRNEDCYKLALNWSMADSVSS